MARPRETQRSQLIGRGGPVRAGAGGDVFAGLGRLLDVGVAVGSAGAGRSVKTAGKERKVRVDSLHAAIGIETLKLHESSHDSTANQTHEQMF